MAKLFVPYLCKCSILEATKRIFVSKNDSSIYLCQEVKMDNYHPGRLFWAQISVQRNMVGFVVDSHILLDAGSLLSCREDTDIQIYMYIFTFLLPAEFWAPLF